MLVITSLLSHWGCSESSSQENPSEEWAVKYPPEAAFFPAAMLPASTHPVARYLWDESYTAQPPLSLTALLLLDDDTAPAEPNLPPAAVFRCQPMAFLRTGWKPGDTLLAVNNVRRYSGHGHQDRGSIILEYGGEQLLLDPGMVSYSDPAGWQYKETFCHNALTFSQQSQAGGLGVYDTAVAGFFEHLRRSLPRPPRLHRLGGHGCCRGLPPGANIPSARRVSQAERVRAVRRGGG